MRRVLVLFAVLLLAACGGGPDAPTLRRDVEARLAQALPAGTLTLVELTRRGSQADTRAPAGETRRTLYFDAVLRVERDFDFGAWDAPGVAALVSALGAGPKGISGLNSDGNQAGDLIAAHGTALYRAEGEAWVAVTTGGYRPATAPAYATNERQGAGAILDAMRKVVDSVPQDAAPAQRAVIEQELAAAHAAIRARLARAANGYAIAAGGEHGQYLRFARALSDDEQARTVPLITRGGDENLRLLRERKVSLALAQGDAALDAYAGTGTFFGDGPNDTLLAIGSLYPEPMHVLVRDDSGVRMLAGLKGKRVAIGLPGAASRTTALRVLEAHGLGLSDIEAVELSIGDALIALRQGNVDAVMQVIGLPADSIRDALVDVPLRLLPLSAPAVAKLVAANQGYFAYTIAQRSYATQDEDVATVATAALLLVATDLSETEVAAVTRFVFGRGRDFAARGSAQGTQVSAATARAGLPVPLHVAAARELDALLAGGSTRGGSR